MKALFLDDERTPDQVTWVKLPEVEWDIVRTYWQLKKWVQENGVPEIISFDHDLGDPLYDGKKCAELVYFICIMDGVPPPKQVYIHSMNPVGAKNIQCFIDWSMTQIQPVD